MADSFLIIRRPMLMPDFRALRVSIFTILPMAGLIRIELPIRMRRKWPLIPSCGLSSAAAGRITTLVSLPGGEWENYTRTYPTGAFNVYARLARGAGGNATMGMSRVTGGWGSATQTTSSLGSFSMGFTGGWQTYNWVPLKDWVGKSRHRPALGHKHAPVYGWRGEPELLHAHSSPGVGCRKEWQ